METPISSLSPLDGTRVLDEAEREMQALHGTFRIVEPSTVALERSLGSTASTSIRGWVVPQQGWIFLISAPDEAAADALANVLEARLAAIEEAGS